MAPYRQRWTKYRLIMVFWQHVAPRLCELSQKCPLSRKALGYGAMAHSSHSSIPLLFSVIPVVVGRNLPGGYPEALRRICAQVKPWRVSRYPSPVVIYGLHPFGKQEIFLMREGLRSYIRLRGGTSCVPSLDGCRAAAPQHSHGLLVQPMTETRVCSRGGDHSCPSSGDLLLRTPW
jgi:hypothetical protein